MKTTSFTAAALASALLMLHPAAIAQWAPSWYASPQAAWPSSFVLPTGLPATLSNETVFERMRLSVGGKAMRLMYSNRYGDKPLHIGAASIRRERDTAPRQVLFGGREDIEIAPGASAVSDPVELTLDSLSSVVVATWFPERVKVATFHWGGEQTALTLAGKRTRDIAKPDARRVHGRMFVTQLLVDSPRPRTVVALGDSITDGNGSTPDRDRRWPDRLAERLAPMGVSVVNAGISGGQLRNDMMGQNALARLERDVLIQPGLETVVVLIGINDIGWPGSPFAPGAPAARLDDLTASYRQLIAAAHTHGVRVVIGTLPPFEGALAGTPLEGHYSTAKDRVRQELNAWIRSGSGADAVADFDALLRDPAHPARLLSKFDSSDHLHPGDAGYAAMADLLNDDLLFGI